MKKLLLLFISISVPNPQNTIELQPAAKPSRPSVKLTELLREIIVKNDIGNMKPCTLRVKSLKNLILGDTKLFPDIKTIKINVTIIWSINFSFPLSPKLVWLLILLKSSIRPIKKKPRTPVKKDIFNKKVEKFIDRRIIKKIGIMNKPPIVGVFSFLMWVEGISSLIFWRKLFFFKNINPYLVDKIDEKKDKRNKVKKYKFLK